MIRYKLTHPSLSREIFVTLYSSHRDQLSRVRFEGSAPGVRLVRKALEASHGAGVQNLSSDQAELTPVELDAMLSHAAMAGFSPTLVEGDGIMHPDPRATRDGLTADIAELSATLLARAVRSDFDPQSYHGHILLRTALAVRDGCADWLSHWNSPDDAAAALAGPLAHCFNATSERNRTIQRADVSEDPYPQAPLSDEGSLRIARALVDVFSSINAPTAEEFIQAIRQRLLETRPDRP